MESLELVHYPNKILKMACADVTEIDQELVDFVKAMSQTMYVSHGIGLAAPQVGKNIKVVTMDVEQEEGKDTLMQLINPMIVDAHGWTTYEEGCLSFPGISAEVKRRDQIHVKAYDTSGRELDFEADGLLAICVQHELDHLKGITFVDRLDPIMKRMVLKEYKSYRLEAALEARDAEIKRMHEG
jgi:peptide deformylase